MNTLTTKFVNKMLNKNTYIHKSDQISSLV